LKKYAATFGARGLEKIKERELQGALEITIFYADLVSFIIIL